jgi:hypothetical protein
VNVTVGLVNSHYVEIRSGLQEGDQVIYSGYEMLKEGDPVVPTEWGPTGPLTLPPATGEERPVAGIVYTCPMHPEVRMDKPGNCPKCGMKLQPVKATTGSKQGQDQGTRGTATAASTDGRQGIYYCPMHPEVQSDHPGKCPKCGMDLVPKPRNPRAGSPVREGSR